MTTDEVATPVRHVSWGRELGRFGVVIGLVVSFVIFSALKPDSFPTKDNMILVLSSVATLGLLAIAVTAVLAAGEFDLSVGFISSMAVVLGAGLVANQGLPWPIAFVLAILCGGLAGLVNGFLIGYLNLSAFVVTLATGSLIQGVTSWYSGDQRIFENIPADFTTIGQGRPFGVPGPVFALIGVAVIIWVVLDKLKAGRHLYARGANRRAAVFAGLSIQRSALLAFTLSGLVSATAGVVIVSQVGSASPDLGTPLLLPAYAAAFLGFVTFRPGQFNIWGTAAGVLLLGMATNGLLQVGAPNWTTEVVQGVILLAAVIFTVRRTGSSA